MSEFKSNGATFSYTETGTPDGPVILWGHGWGQDHSAFMPLAESLPRAGRHITLDFPGFGASDTPNTAWGTEDYADAIAAWLTEQEIKNIIWIGHSFGGRVGLQLAARNPELIRGMVLISAAGLKRHLALHTKIYRGLRVRTFKTLKALIPLGVNETWLRDKFGSSDYNQTSGVLRDIFVRVVNEDLSPQAAQVKCPVHLVYGDNDTETPPEIGERLSGLIPNSQLFLLPGQDHYSVLTHGRHGVVKIIARFIEKI